MKTPENKLSLKVLIDTKRNKVLFAEAGSDFVDVLFGFLTLPVGTIIQQLDKHCNKQTSSLGCLKNLYSSVRNLSSSCFSTEESKLMLLHSQNASEIECQKLKLKIDSKHTKYYLCSRSLEAISFSSISLSCGSTALSTYNTLRCSCCGYLMNSLKTVNTQDQEKSTNGIFTAAAKSFIITEDLRVMPTVEILNFELFRNLVNGADATEEQILYVGLKEIMILLKLSLISRTPLTNFFHELKGHGNTVINPDFMALSPQFLGGVKTDGSIKLRALVQILTRKVVLFMGGDDFVELLFRILSIPLGSVISLLGGSSSIGSVNNLYKSISDLPPQFFSSSSAKTSLINPKLPKQYLSQKTNKLLPLSESSSPSDRFLIDPKGGLGYMKSQEAFMITDDLVVSPLSSISIMSYLSAKNISCSDIEELVFEIGTNQALDILRACFTSSNSVLSNALQLFGKQPKKEKGSL